MCSPQHAWCACLFLFLLCIFICLLVFYFTPAYTGFAIQVIDQNCSWSLSTEHKQGGGSKPPFPLPCPRPRPLSPTHSHPPAEAPVAPRCSDEGLQTAGEWTGLSRWTPYTHWLPVDLPCSPLQDWSKAGQYEQPTATLQRRKEPLDRLRENEGSPSSQGYVGSSHLDDAHRSRAAAASMAAKVTQECCCRFGRFSADCSRCIGYVFWYIFRNTNVWQYFSKCFVVVQNKFEATPNKTSFSGSRNIIDPHLARTDIDR